MPVLEAPVAEVLNRPPSEIRRFQIPDMDRHGRWILQRLMKSYPHLTQQTLIGWLRGLIYNNDCLFLFQDHSVALAQVERSHTLAPKPIVRERFVWAQSEEFVDEAADFYERFATWARQQGCDTVVVLEMSDVPEEKVRKRLGRLLTRPQVFAKVDALLKE